MESLINFAARSGYHFSIITLVFLFCGIFSLITGIVTFRIRKKYNVFYLSLMAFAISWWAFTVIFESSGMSEYAKILWSKISYPGIVTTPVFYFLFALEYGQFKKWINKKTVLLLLSAAGVIFLFALTNEFHYLIWPSIEINPDSYIAVYQHGLVFWIFIAFTYSLLFSGLILYIITIFRYSYFYKSQTLIMIIGSLFPISGNIIYILNWNPVPGLDWTPIGLSFSAALLALGIVGFSFLKKAHIPRSLIIQFINEGFVFVDNRNIILDINNQACGLFHKNKEECLGEPVESVIPQWERVQPFFDREEDFHMENVVEGSSPVFLEISSSYLNLRKKGQGRILLVSDITSHKTVQMELKQLNERLNNQLSLKTELERRLKEEVLRDPLTGAFNRRYLDEITPQLVRDSELCGYSIGLLMIDIDHFKSFNDKYGHDAGDFVLKILVSRLENKTRENDIICRYGGEEFLAIFPRIDRDSIYKKADEWRRDIASEPLNYNSVKLKITISVGISLFPQQGEEFSAVLKAADHAMYLAKASGRNRAVFYKD